MKTVIVYGTERKGSTYNVVQLFVDYLNMSDITEISLPKDMPCFCVGCNNCFMKGEEFCPHKEYVAPIKNALYDAELIILASPTYVLHVSAQMKAFIDHFAFQFMAHRPEESMFQKKALVVSTVGAAGMRPAIKYMVSCLNHWGISKVYTLGAATGAGWENITPQKKAKIQRKVKTLSCKIISSNRKPSLKTKIMFNIFRMIHKKLEFIAYDKEYWKKRGWFESSRPWNSK